LFEKAGGRKPHCRKRHPIYHKWKEEGVTGAGRKKRNIRNKLTTKMKREIRGAIQATDFLFWGWGGFGGGVALKKEKRKRRWRR